MQFCIYCRKPQPYNIFTRKDSIEIRGIVVQYDELYAVCQVCGKEMYVPEINDATIDSINNALYSTSSVG